MNIDATIKRTQKLLEANAPLILSVVGIAGTAATAVLAYKAGYKSAEIILAEEAKEHNDTTPIYPNGLDTMTKVKMTWRVVLPTAASGVGTIAAIAFAQRINAKRIASFAAAYAIAEKAHTEYRDKVIEKLGAKKDAEIHDAVAQDRVNGKVLPPITNSNKVWCYDDWADRYFTSTVEDIKKAQNDTNYEMIHNGYSSVSEFYQRLGLPPVGGARELGWSNEHPIELQFSTVLSEGGTPVEVFSFAEPPRANYYDRSTGGL